MECASPSGEEERVRFPSPPPAMGTKRALTRAEIYDIFVAQSKNVRRLRDALKRHRRRVNEAIRVSDVANCADLTVMYFLTYVAWSEAQFVQILYTPDAFSQREISAILQARKASGIAAAWKVMIDSAIRRAGVPEQNDDLRARLDRLVTIAADVIAEPTTLRNKLAHGQWEVALNEPNTAVNDDLSEAIAKIDAVDVERKIEVHRYIGLIIRDLVQSPKNGFHRYYWGHICSLDEYLKTSQDWTVSTKREQLRRKPRPVMTPT